jgi:hypothetical protein
MASRVVCGVLLFASLLHAQHSPLKGPAANFNSSGAGLTETLLKFAHDQNLRIAIEYVDRDSLDRPIAVNLQKTTIQQGLGVIVRNGNGYKWQIRNGIVEIRNKRCSKRADKLLDAAIPDFKIPAMASVKMASAMLWMNLQAKLDPSVKGFGGSILEGAETSKVNPATLHNRTVREILAYVVLHSRAEGWIVAGPPECLGYTPYCGLWLLVENAPGDPSYRALLDQIRKNF